MRSVYIHIPFCKSICSYCDFPKFLHDNVWAEEYLVHLEKEIKKYYANDCVKSIYIGGGTPSVLSVPNLKKLMKITKIFDLDSDYEFTVEMNVDDVSEEKLKILKNAGVNRISIGIESFDKYILKYLNRKHDKNKIINNVGLVKKYFDNISVDIIYAVPIETMAILRSDIKEVLNLGVKHISTYSLIIEENTILGINKIKNIDEEIDYKMYKYIDKKLEEKGYVHYEVSNYAIPGYESKHNLSYWNNQEYYGFGLGAAGFLDDLRYENTKSFNQYLKDKYRYNELIMSKKEDMENEIILGLRKLEGIDVFEFFNKFKENIQDVFNITPLIKEGYLKMKGKKLYIPSEYIYVMNEILGKILE